MVFACWGTNEEDPDRSGPNPNPTGSTKTLLGTAIQTCQYIEQSFWIHCNTVW